MELALVLPLLLVLLLGAIDFGRVFFGWIALTNSARVAANYASTHPDAWALNNVAQKNEYVTLTRDAGSTNCELHINDPTFPDGGRAIGDRTRADLSCDFSLITPLMGALLGRPVTISADATFPIRRGCVNCAGAPGAPPPPPPPNCRPIPDIVGMSVGGARTAWAAAGFTGSFAPVSAEDAGTVQTRTVDQHGEIGCNGTSNAFFSSSVFVTLAPVTSPTPGETCLTVPNLKGMPVANARAAWGSAGFDPANFTPLTGVDDQVVSTQVFDPAALPGDCEEPTLLATVSYQAPPPPPPAPPCRVPSFVNTARSAAQGTWNGAGFTSTVQYQPAPNNWSIIKTQTLVGGSWAGCGATIVVSKN